MRYLLIAVVLLCAPSWADFSESFSGDCTAEMTGGKFTFSCLVADNKPEPPQVTWTHCANEYGRGDPRDCGFTGLRKVRIGNGQQWSEAEFINGLSAYMCRRSNFPSPAGGWGDGPYWCEYSSEVERELVMAPPNCHERHDCAGFDLNMPKGHDGYSEPRVRPDSAPLNTEADIGAFRAECEFSHFAYADPLVYPNRPGVSHLHVFMGNTGVDAFTDTQALADSGASTCRGGSLNRSAYWMPALIDMATKQPIVPRSAIFYYKEGYNGLAGTGFDNLPEGLGMIGREYYWTCQETGPAQYKAIPSDCSDRIAMHVAFPQCWNGEDKWLQDESHTAYPVSGKCPQSHPVALPEITLNLRYLIEYEGQAENFRLSSDHKDMPPGSTAHADWINGWNPAISKTFIDNCLNKGVDCHANLLGDGTILF